MRTPRCVCVDPPKACAMHAAGPALLKALCKAVDQCASCRGRGYVKSFGDDINCEDCEPFRDAIALARGQS